MVVGSHSHSGFFVRIMNEVRQVDIGDLILREDMMHEAIRKNRELNATGSPVIGKSLETGLGELRAVRAESCVGGGVKKGDGNNMSG